MNARLGERAVVVGGGMAGLFAGRVLHPHFEEVLIVDRDAEPNDDPRPSVPQGNHFHVLLPGGLDAMNTWFPGFSDDLARRGAVQMTLGRDFYAYMPEGRSYSLQRYQPEPGEGPRTYVQTRPQLESCVRTRVASLDNVGLRHGVVVDGPWVVDGRVAGVTVRGGDTIEADLVVDAGGRTSLTERWLPAMGYEVADKSHVNCDVHYTSVVVEPEDWDAFDGAVFFITPSREGEFGSRFGAVVKMPDRQWLVAVGSRYRDPAPTDWAGFLAAGRTLPYQDAWSVVEGTTPITDVHTYRLKSAVRRHYETIDAFPEGLLPIGDAVCFFNPTHGQGMSAAAGQCRGLEAILDARARDDRGLDGLAMEFFPDAAEWVRGPWATAAVTDFEHPDCTGDFPTDEIADLTAVLEVATSVPQDSPEMDVVFDIMLLRRPLSDIRSLAPA